MPTAKSSLGDPQTRLAEHLMTFYWRGKLDMSDPNDLVPQFFQSPSLNIRAHAIEFIGRSLANTEGRVPDDIVERLKAFWSWRLEVLSSLPSEVAEIDSFGWWFTSNKFADEWAIKQVRSCLLLSSNIEPADQVAEKLESLSTTFPGTAAECVALMASSTKQDWQIGLWRPKALSILKNAVASKDARTQALGKRGANVFGRRGFLEFRQVAK
jgi:hypothetical protein